MMLKTHSNFFGFRILAVLDYTNTSDRLMPLKYFFVKYLGSPFLDLP